MKICYKCKMGKDKSAFCKDKNRKDGLHIWCKKCSKEHRQEHKEELKEYRKQYRETNKKRISEYHKQYAQSEDGKQKLQEYSLKYYKEKKAEINKKHRKHYKNNKERVITKQKEYKQGNIEKVRETLTKYIRNRRRKDPSYRLRGNVSSVIYKALKHNNSDKYGVSCFKHLKYNSEDLRQHLESLWEPWMNWDNYGPHIQNKQTWQIDHIIPQSKLPYTSMEDENFQKCWVLENLRPLESFENIKKSNKIIH